MALLSAFAEMGLKLRMDLPEQAMEVTTIFFRNSTPASEASVSISSNSQYCPIVFGSSNIVFLILFVGEFEKIFSRKSQENEGHSGKDATK